MRNGRDGSAGGQILQRNASPSVRDGGFTLLEIVVALVVLGILLVTLSRGTQFGLAAFDRQDRMIAVGGRLEAVDRTLRRLIVQLDPGTVTDGATVIGARHVLVFRSRLPVGEAGTPADLRLSVDDAHHLVLAWLPHRHVKAVGAAPKPHRETLLDDVDAINLDYWGDGAWHGQWKETAPPSLIRIRIVFPDGDPRRWPDIVAAPARDQANG